MKKLHVSVTFEIELEQSAAELEADLMQQLHSENWEEVCTYVDYVLLADGLIKRVHVVEASDDDEPELDEG